MLLLANLVEFLYLQVDHWLEFASGRLNCSSDFRDAIDYLDYVLGPITYLVAHDVTIADFAVWGTLRGNKLICY